MITVERMDSLKLSGKQRLDRIEELEAKLQDAAKSFETEVSMHNQEWLEHEATKRKLQVAVDALEYMDQRFKGTHPSDSYIRSTRAAGVISEALEKIKV